MSSIDNSNNLDYYKVVNQLTQAITQLNSNHKVDVHNVYGSIDKSKGIGSRNPYMPEDKRLITITNPERLNGRGLTITKGWNIEYIGRDLSLDVDNYRWDVYSDYDNKRVRGYYIIERELIEGDWLNVRWGVMPVNVKERKEVIDKKRLRDKDRIQSDMISVINSIK
jgi:hypothetical protein